MDTSKPANGAEPEQEYLYPAAGRLGKHFFGEAILAAYTGFTWAEGTATQGCDRSADSAAGIMGWRKPPYEQHSGAKAINPRGLGTESPSKREHFTVFSAAVNRNRECYRGPEKVWTQKRR